MERCVGYFKAQLKKMEMDSTTLDSKICTVLFFFFFITSSCYKGNTEHATDEKEAQVPGYPPLP